MPRVSLLSMFFLALSFWAVSGGSLSAQDTLPSPPTIPPPAPEGIDPDAWAYIWSNIPPEGQHKINEYGGWWWYVGETWGGSEVHEFIGPGNYAYSYGFGPDLVCDAKMNVPLFWIASAGADAYILQKWEWFSLDRYNKSTAPTALGAASVTGSFIAETRALASPLEGGATASAGGQLSGPRDIDSQTFSQASSTDSSSPADADVVPPASVPYARAASIEHTDRLEVYARASGSASAFIWGSAVSASSSLMIEYKLNTLAGATIFP